jgi:hypothetical protein
LEGEGELIEGQIQERFLGNLVGVRVDPRQLAVDPILEGLLMFQIRAREDVVKTPLVIVESHPNLAVHASLIQAYHGRPMDSLVVDGGIGVSGCQLSFS